MEPNKLETQIREKLNAREIMPTEMAWDRLDAMLTVAEEKKRKKGFGWIYIAASFLALATVGGLYYNQNSSPKKSNATVVIDDKNTDTISTGKVEKYLNTVQIQENKAVVNTEINQNQNSVNYKPKSLKQPKSIINQNHNREVIAQVFPKKQSTLESQKELKLILVNPEILLSQVELGTKNDSQKEVSLTQKSLVKVDASSLLSQVSSEIIQDYRESRFDKLKRNFKAVKVAVISRNNQ